MAMLAALHTVLPTNSPLTPLHAGTSLKEALWSADLIAGAARRIRPKNLMK